MNQSTTPASDIVAPHRYSAKILYRGPGAWPKLKGELYERDVLIGTFKRGAVRNHFVPPIEHKFFSDAAATRFESFADSLSIEETIEALLPFHQGAKP